MDCLDDMDEYNYRDEYIEVYKTHKKTESFTYKDGGSKEATIEENQGVGVRVFHNGKKGTSYSNGNSVDLDVLIEIALQNMEFSESEENPPKIDNIENNTLEMLQSFKKEDYSNLVDIINSNKTENSLITKGVLKKTDYSVEISNNRGVQLCDYQSYFSGVIEAKAEKYGIMEGSYESLISRDIDDINIEKMANKAIYNANSMLGAKPFNENAMILLDNKVAISLFKLIVNSFNAKNYLENRSMFKGRENEEYYKELNIIDDGKLIRGIGTSLFDGEGVPQTTTNLLVNGKINSFLHNSYTSDKMGVKNTGNGYRSSLSDVDISHTNLIIKEGNTDFNSIIKGTENIFLVKNIMGLHLVDTVKGDFSLGAAGFLYKNGEKRAVNGVTISGNLILFMKNIVTICNDSERYGAMSSPKILVEGIKITGAGE
ncbi:MAG: TldD/PmbA family protein [Fusobacteria bacterium]|nr:TldD/PmbA family protein [Fusobacteriota bacterium]